MREKQIKKYNHLKILDIKEQLQELLESHLIATNRYPQLKRTSGLKQEYQITRNDVRFLFELDAKDFKEGRDSGQLQSSREGSFERPSTIENDNPFAENRKKKRNLGKLPTCQHQYKTYQYGLKRNFIQEALEDLPEGQLLKLVEILFEEPKSQINIYKNM